jgi:ornithine carbamoyltransferase
VRDFLDLHKVEPDDLRGILTSAARMKTFRTGLPKAEIDDGAPLAGRMVALIFEKPSTRTRVSFDVGVKQLGGQTLVVTGSEMQLGHGESIADTARVLSRYVDLIMIRTFAERTLLELAENASVPVINGLTDRSHPCQVMADVMTFEEHRGPIRDTKVVWSGDGNNVCASFLHAAGQFGFDVTFAGPASLDPNPDAIDFARKKGVGVTIERDLLCAVDGAGLVVTDTWLSMHDADSARQERHALLRPYQVTEAVMAAARPDALFMHCLPAHRGQEATDGVMDGPSSVVFDEAENRLHAQKAIMRWCLEL